MLALAFLAIAIAFSLVGVSGDGEHGDVGGDVENKGDCLGLGIVVG